MLITGGRFADFLADYVDSGMCVGNTRAREAVCEIEDEVLADRDGCDRSNPST